MLTTALALVLLASAGAQPGVPAPKTTLDAADPRAPVAADPWDDLFGPAATPTPAPAVAEEPMLVQPVASPAKKKKSKAKGANLLGRQPVLRGELASRYATVDILQSGLPGSWTVTLDGGTVGKLDGNDARVRVSMIPPGHHTLAIFNQRGTLWSGRVTLNADQVLVIDARENALVASDPLSMKSDAELRQERLAKTR